MTFRPFPASPIPIIKGINAKTVATTSQIIDPNMSFILYAVYFEAGSLTGTGSFTFSVGTNAATYNNLVASSAWNPATVHQFVKFSPTTGAPIIAPNTAVVLNITAGSAATTFSLNWFLHGELF